MTVMGREEISRRLLPETPWAERLVIEPQIGPLDSQTAAASLDFHLGNRFRIFRRRRDVLHDPLDVRRDSLGFLREADVATEEFFVSFGDYFVVHPGHLVLGSTLEWFRFPLDVMAYVIGRSIWGRRGLLVATATAVHPGSAGTIALELSNIGEIAVALKPGVSIGQIFFHRVEGGIGEGARTSFAGSLHPDLGRYVPSDIERFLLGF